MYKVTVLIAIYKSGEYIDSKIKSIIQMQDFKDTEFIFLNCQNLHEESEKIKPLCLQYPNIKQLHFDQHVNLYMTWNAGIQLSNSEYITNYNADDQWHPKYIRKCVEYLDKNKDVAIVSTKVLKTYTPNQVHPNWSYHDRMPVYAYPLSSAGPSPMWRRSLHGVYGLVGDYRVIGDARFWEQLHAGNERFGLLEEDLVLYYVTSESLERRVDNITGHTYIDLDLSKTPDIK